MSRVLEITSSRVSLARGALPFLSPKFRRDRGENNPGGYFLSPPLFFFIASFYRGCEGDSSATSVKVHVRSERGAFDFAEVCELREASFRSCVT